MTSSNLWGAYRKAFDEFVSLSQAKDLALEMASWSVSSVANNLDVLQAGLADDGAYTLKESAGKDGAQFIEQANQVSQVSRLMLQAMNEARVRLDQSRKGDDSGGQGKIEQADQALTQAEQLKTTIKDEGYQTVLNEVAGHIAGFSEKNSPSTPGYWRRKRPSTSSSTSAPLKWWSGWIRPTLPKTSRCRQS